MAGKTLHSWYLTNLVEICGNLKPIDINVFFMYDKTAVPTDVRVMASVFVVAKNGSANVKMDGVAKTVLRHKRPTAGMILTTIMVSN